VLNSRGFDKRSGFWVKLTNAHVDERVRAKAVLCPAFPHPVFHELPGRDIMLSRPGSSNAAEKTTCLAHIAFWTSRPHRHFFPESYFRGFLFVPLLLTPGFSA